MCVQDEKHLRGKSKYETLSTVAKGVMFTTRSMKALSSRYRAASAEYESKQAELVHKCIGVVGEAGARGAAQAQRMHET